MVDKIKNILSIDYGLSRTGLAQGSSKFKIATPLTTIYSKNIENTINELKKIIEDWQIDEIIVGLPLHVDGKEHKMTKNCYNFANKLYESTKINIYLVDERLSSYSAHSILNELGIKGIKQKKYLDQLAAVEILKTYFDYGYIKTIPQHI